MQQSWKYSDISIQYIILDVWFWEILDYAFFVMSDALGDRESGLFMNF